MSGATGSVPERLRALLADQLGITVPRADTDLIAEGLIDSLALVEMLFEIENEFGVKVELESFDVEQFRTLERLAAWIEARPPRRLHVA